MDDISTCQWSMRINILVKDKNKMDKIKLLIIQLVFLSAFGFLALILWALITERIAITF